MVRLVAKVEALLAHVRRRRQSGGAAARERQVAVDHLVCRHVPHLVCQAVAGRWPSRPWMRIELAGIGRMYGAPITAIAHVRLAPPAPVDRSRKLQVRTHPMARHMLVVRLLVCI